MYVCVPTLCGCVRVFVPTLCVCVCVRARWQVRDGLRKGTIPRNGLCKSCEVQGVWVSTISATIFPYCSPGCRIALRLPEESADTELPPELASEITAASITAPPVVDTTTASPSTSRCTWRVCVC